MSKQYDLQQDHNTGNWWIVEQDESGYRTIVRTLSGKLGFLDAKRYLNNYIKEKQDEE